MIQFTIPSFPSLRESMSWLRATRGELAIVALLTVAAVVPRVVHLVGIPPGLHGDEAWTGIRADAILQGTNIGPFDRIHGLGQPAGMEYLTAAFVWVFGSSVLTLRLPMALLGAATVPLTYWLIRELVNDRTTAFIGAALLAFLGWHIHFSRIALPPISWPFFEVLSCLLFVLAMRTGKWWQFILAGLSLGAGIYSYSSYSIFVLAFAAFAVYWLLTQHLEQARRLLLGVGVVFVVALLVALPMLDYIKSHSHTYFDYPRGISIFRSQEYKSASGELERADVLANAGRDFVQRVLFKPVSDFSDGTGSGPMLDRTFSILLGLGMLLALWRWRQPGAALPLLVVLIVPWAGILTTGGGIVRRAVGVTPFLAMLAALPLAELVRRTQLARPLVRGAAYFVVASAIISVGVLDLRSYFGTFSGSDVGRFVFVPELVAASKYMDTLPRDTLIYFYSDRWSFNYETRRYLAPGRDGVDRSKEFGSFTLAADRARDAALVFLGRYRGRLEEAERLYPDGVPTEQLSGKGTEFRALFLPKGGPPAAGGGPAPTPPPTLGGETRDQKRMADMQTIQQALVTYKQRHGLYPDNGGAVQTLCVYPEDIGCKLKDVLSPLPEDPLGDATHNGYFYSSDGHTYKLYAMRESSIFPACADQPAYLAGLPSLLCVSAP